MTTLSVCQWGACTLTFSTVLDLRNHVKTDHIANGKAIINVNDFEFASRGDGGWYARPKEGVVIAGTPIDLPPLSSLSPHSSSTTHPSSSGSDPSRTISVRLSSSNQNPSTASASALPSHLLPSESQNPSPTPTSLSHLSDQLQPSPASHSNPSNSPNLHQRTTTSITTTTMTFSSPASAFNSNPNAHPSPANSTSSATSQTPARHVSRPSGGIGALPLPSARKSIFGGISDAMRFSFGFGSGASEGEEQGEVSDRAGDPPTRLEGEGPASPLINSARLQPALANLNCNPTLSPAKPSSPLASLTFGITPIASQPNIDALNLSPTNSSRSRSSSQSSQLGAQTQLDLAHHRQLAARRDSDDDPLLVRQTPLTSNRHSSSPHHHTHRQRDPRSSSPPLGAHTQFEIREHERRITGGEGEGEEREREERQESMMSYLESMGSDDEILSQAGVGSDGEGERSSGSIKRGAEAVDSERDGPKGRVEGSKKARFGI